jgi:hypothetical protein
LVSLGLGEKQTKNEKKIFCEKLVFVCFSLAYLTKLKEKIENLRKKMGKTEMSNIRILSVQNLSKKN